MRKTGPKKIKLNLDDLIKIMAKVYTDGYERALQENIDERAALGAEAVVGIYKEIKNKFSETYYKSMIRNVTDELKAFENEELESEVDVDSPEDLLNLIEKVKKGTKGDDLPDNDFGANEPLYKAEDIAKYNSISVSVGVLGSSGKRMNQRQLKEIKRMSYLDITKHDSIAKSVKEFDRVTKI
jgi:hypothetical protein